jgi:syntaxin-binding protein 1
MGGPAPSGSGGKGGEVGGDGLTKRLAMQIQGDLDEYMANNPEFPVGLLRT